MEETKKKFQVFIWGYDFSLPLSPRKKKNEREKNHNALPGSINVSDLHDQVEELKRSQQNIQQNTQ